MPSVCQPNKGAPIMGPDFPGLQEYSGKGILEIMRLAKEMDRLELRAAKEPKNKCHEVCENLVDQENITVQSVKCADLDPHFKRKRLQLKFRKLSADYIPPKRLPFCRSELERWTSTEISDAFDRLRAKRSRQRRTDDSRDFQPTSDDPKIQDSTSSKELEKWTSEEVENRNTLDRLKAERSSKLSKVSRGFKPIKRNLNIQDTTGIIQICTFFLVFFLFCYIFIYWI